MANMYNPGYLSQEQDDLLMAALNSNAQNQNTGFPNALSNYSNQDFTSTSLDPSMLTTAAPDNIFAELDGLNSFNDQQYLDFFDQSGLPADYDPNQEQDDDNSAEQDDDAEDHLEGGEKRKNSADGAGDESNAKRREGEEKQAKKPGRKPLTSEPTTKRKAQNRAAQRAFRERKEKHLRDLEDKVAELEKTSETTSHENGLLKAQVEKLQMELREYRKRLSIQSSLGRSPPTSTLGSFSNANVANNPFNYNYGRQADAQYGPLFGSWSMQTSPQSTTTTHRGSTVAASRNGSTDATSPVSAQVATPLSDAVRSHNGSVSNGSPAVTSSNPAINRVGDGNYNIFMSPTQENAPAPQRQDSQSSASRLFQFNTSSNSSASPSASSSSQYGGNSSCGTSPEPTTGGSGKEPGLDTIDESGKDFCAELSKACGTKTNPTPLAKSTPLNAANLDAVNAESTNAPFVFSANNNTDLFSASWPETSQGEQQSGVVGDGAFTGGFMNDTANFWDMSWNDLTGSQRTGLTPAAQKDNPFDLVNTLEDIKEEVVPADPQMLSCNKIWSKIQSRQDFRDGNLDIDNLCSELRKKARCSESGVVVDKSDVDAALLRLPKGAKPPTPKSMTGL